MKLKLKLRSKYYLFVNEKTGRLVTGMFGTNLEYMERVKEIGEVIVAVKLVPVKPVKRKKP